MQPLRDFAVLLVVGIEIIKDLWILRLAPFGVLHHRIGRVVDLLAAGVTVEALHLLDRIARGTHQQAVAHDRQQVHQQLFPQPLIDQRLMDLVTRCQAAEGRFFVAGVVVDVQIGMGLPAHFHPLHEIVERLLLLSRRMGPPPLELQRTGWIPITGAKKIFELLATDRIGEALHVEPDVALIGGRQHLQPTALLLRRSHLKGGSAIAAVLACHLNAGLIAQARQDGILESVHPAICRQSCQRVDRGDAGSPQLLPLALAQASDQDQITLVLEPLLDERLP